MPISFLPTRSARLGIAAAALAIGLSGCTGANPGAPSSVPLPGVPSSATSTTTSPSKTPEAAAPDYGKLLLTGPDLTDTDDTFTRRSETPNPNGSTGASAFFVNDKDNRAITDTVLVYADAAAATATLQKATSTLPTQVAGGTPKPVPVGSDGVMVSGTYPDQDKAVTLIFFAQDRAVVRLEFQSAPGDATTDKFVTNVAKMQQIALRVGLPASQ